MLYHINSWLFPQNKEGTINISSHPYRECTATASTCPKQKKIALLLPSYLMLSPLMCQKQPLPFKILLLEFESHQIIKTRVWSNPVGLTQLEEYNLAPYIYSYIILFNLTLSVCFYHAGHMQQLRHQAGLGQAQLSGTTHQRPICQAFPKRLAEQTQRANEEQKFFLAISFSRRKQHLLGGKDGSAWNTLFSLQGSGQEKLGGLICQSLEKEYSIFLYLQTKPKYILASAV